MSEQIYRFSAKTQVYFGSGSTKIVGIEAARAGISNAMIVTDPGVYQAGLVEDVENYLASQNISYQIYYNVEEDADVNVIHDIALRIVDNRSNGIVVVGGGSPICAAKGAALKVTNNVDDIRTIFGNNRFKELPLPVICLPTTAGSGSDVTEGFPVVDYENRTHAGISGDGIGPRVSIIDPELLRTIPREPMLYAAIDALSHALDALWNKQSNAMSDALAYEAIRIIMNNVQEAVSTNNLTARMNQHIGSTLGMISAGQSGLGIIHAFGGLLFSAKGPHGYKCGLFIPAALEFNLPVCEEKFATIATIIGEEQKGKTRGELARQFVKRVRQLLIELEFPQKFREEDASRENIPEIMLEMREGNNARFLENNMRDVSEYDVQEMLESSIEG